MCLWLDQRGDRMFGTSQCVFTIQTHIQDIFSPSRSLQYISCILRTAPNVLDIGVRWGRMCHLPPMTCVSWPMVFIESCFLSVCTLTREDGWLTSSDIMSMACVTCPPVVFVVEFWHLYRITDGRSANTYVRNECVTYSCLTSFQWQVTGGWWIYSRMQISSPTSS